MSAQSSHKDEQENGRYFGDRDFILPYAIGGAAALFLTVAMLTVGSHAVHLSTGLAFAGVIVWLVLGLCLVLVVPIMIGVSVKWKKKFLGIAFFVLLGLAYFIVSGMMMASFSLPIE